MADQRPRVWVSQPLFDDTVAQLATYCDVVATPEIIIAGKTLLRTRNCITLPCAMLMIRPLSSAQKEVSGVYRSAKNQSIKERES